MGKRHETLPICVNSQPAIKGELPGDLYNIRMVDAVTFVEKMALLGTAYATGLECDLVTAQNPATDKMK